MKVGEVSLERLADSVADSVVAETIDLGFALIQKCFNEVTGEFIAISGVNGDKAVMITA